MPIIALICLGFALMWKYPRPILAGLAFGGAASMKATAWPAVVVAVSLALARDGKRAAAIMTGVSLSVFAVLVGEDLKLKNLADGAQQDVILADLPGLLK